jgi:hypothetical protein
LERAPLFSLSALAAVRTSAQGLFNLALMMTLTTKEPTPQRRCCCAHGYAARRLQETCFEKKGGVPFWLHSSFALIRFLQLMAEI